jgi:hypothetical protein
MVRKLKDEHGRNFPAGTIFTRNYEQVVIPENDPWPRFTVILHPRPRHMNDEEYRRACLETEQIYRSKGTILGLAQLSVTRLGWWKTCWKPVCRRKRACFARKREDDWSMGSGPMMPRCCDTFDKIETVKKMVWDITHRRSSGDK